MLWALDDPGYIMKHSMVNGFTLVPQMANNPSYIVTVSAKATHQSEINLNASFEINLYSPGFNFTLPGVFEEGTVDAVPPLFPLSPVTGTPRIWLDDEEFAVGVDFTFMSTPNMLRSVNTSCIPLNALNVTDMQVWNCDVPNNEAAGILDMSQGLVQIWWDVFHIDLLAPYGDNPWASYEKGGGSVMMKEVFTITKGHRRHTFKQVVIKATTSVPAPETLDSVLVTVLFSSPASASYAKI